nr:hypothetical protein [Tanacetum cinerariifolium]
MRTRSQSRNNFPQREASPVIVEPLRIELPFLEDQFQEDPPEDPPEVSMADNRTMAELLQVPTEGYEDAIIILKIAANNFELKHGLINHVQNKQFFRHDKEDPHAHIRYFNKITSTMRVPNQRFDESFYEAWDHFNDLLRACPHHGFFELHQLDTFYNALNVNDQDSLNFAAGGNLLDKMPRECLKIIKSKFKVRQSRAKTIVAKVSTSSSTPAISSEVAELKDMVRALLLDKKNQSSIPALSPTPALVKEVEPNCVTCDGNVEDKILVPKPPKNYARCAKCGHPVNDPYCQGCALLREKLEEDQDHGVNPPHIDKCCCECGNALDGIFYQQCTCKSCGKGPHETFQCQPTNEDYYHEQNSCYNSNSFGSDHCQPSQYTINHPIFNAHNDFINSKNELSIAQTTIMEKMTQLTSMCELVCQIFQKKQEEKRIEEEQAASARYWKITACCDDDDDYDSAITPVLSTEEIDNSLSMGDKHLDTIPATKSDEVTKSSVEDLVPIPSEFEGFPDTMCDVHLVNNPTPLEAKDHFEIVINSNDDISSNDDYSIQ